VQEEQQVLCVAPWLAGPLCLEVNSSEDFYETLLSPHQLVVLVSLVCPSQHCNVKTLELF
jgi:hypothetical protein